MLVYQNRQVVTTRAGAHVHHVLSAMNSARMAKPTFAERPTTATPLPRPGRTITSTSRTANSTPPASEAITSNFANHSLPKRRNDLTLVASHESTPSRSSRLGVVQVGQVSDQGEARHVRDAAARFAVSTNCSAARFIFFSSTDVRF